MIFVFTVPLWFAVLWLVIEGVCEISENTGLYEPPRVWTKEDHAIQDRADAGRAGVTVDTWILLRKLAKSHGMKGATYKVWTDDELAVKQ